MGVPLPLPLLLTGALCLFAALCSQGWALQCYHCHSRGNASCGDPFSPEEARLVTCSRPQQLCGKITHAADHRAGVERRCVSGGGSAAWANGHVYTCGEDACNRAANLPTAPSVLTSSMVVVASVAVGRAL